MCSEKKYGIRLSEERCFQDAWSKIDSFSVSSTFDQFRDSLLRAFLKVFSETVHQLVVGNNTQAMEYILGCLNFLGIQISNEQKADEKYNKTLPDEFYTAHSKMLAYLSIMRKMRQILANGEGIINGLLSILEQGSDEVIVVRKRYFFQTLADFLHHVRSSLPIDMLAHVAFILCREMHDNLLPYHRMLSSVLERLLKHGKEGQATRDLALIILESLMVKMKEITVYHMPLLFRQHGAEINYDYKSSDRDGSKSVEDEKSSDKNVIREEVRRCSIDAAHEMENGPAGLTVNASPYENSSVAHGSDGEQTHRSRVCDSPSKLTSPHLLYSLALLLLSKLLFSSSMIV